MLQIEQFKLFVTNQCPAIYCKTEKLSLNSANKDHIEVFSKRISVTGKTLSKIVIIALCLPAFFKVK